MDEHLSYIIEQKILMIIEKLRKNNMNGYYARSKDQVVDIVKDLLEKESTVAVGGSNTLFEAGIIEFLRSDTYSFYDRHQKVLSSDEIREIYIKSFSADAYLCSTNAITESGELVNMDGTGNRVAAMIYGPKKVIIIAGSNKIVRDIDEGITRIKNWSAPVNGKRLNKATPCAAIAQCLDCSNDDRMCNNFTIIHKQRNKDRIHVILVNDTLGY